MIRGQIAGIVPARSPEYNDDKDTPAFKKALALESDIDESTDDESDDESSTTKGKPGKLPMDAAISRSSIALNCLF